MCRPWMSTRAATMDTRVEAPQKLKGERPCGPAGSSEPINTETPAHPHYCCSVQIAESAQIPRRTEKETAWNILP